MTDYPRTLTEEENRKLIEHILSVYDGVGEVRLELFVKGERAGWATGDMYEDTAGIQFNLTNGSLTFQIEDITHCGITREGQLTITVAL